MNRAPGLTVSDVRSAKEQRKAALENKVCQGGRSLHGELSAVAEKPIRVFPGPFQREPGESGPRLLVGELSRIP